MKNKHFSLVEMLVAFGVLLVIVSLLQPTMDKMVGQAKTIQCSTQVKWLLSAFEQYSEDNEVYPNADTNSEGWVDRGNSPSHITNGPIYEYIGSMDPFLCPDDPTNHIRSYSVSNQVNNFRQRASWGLDLFINVRNTPSPTKTMVLIEEHDPRWFNMGSYVPGGWTFWIDNVAGWHNLGNNIGLMDGHVDYVQWVDEETPNRFVERRNFRNHEDMQLLVRYYTAGQIKP